MKIRNTFVLLFIVLTYNSCYKDINMEKYRSKPYIVLNCIANCDTTILAELSSSWFYTDNYYSQETPKARIGLYINGKYKEDMIYNKGIYQSNYHPIPGDSISVNTIINGVEIFAADYMPLETKITNIEITQTEVPGAGNVYIDPDNKMIINETDKEFTYNITFRNTCGKQFYYLQIDVDGTKSFLGEMNYSYEPAFRITEEKINKTLSSTKIGGQFGLPFSNESMNEGDNTLVIKETGPAFEYNSEEKCRRVITLYTISEAYYKYILTLLANDSDSSWQGGLSDIGLSEPIKIYSNINGGIGIFGCITPTRKKISLPFSLVSRE